MGGVRLKLEGFDEIIHQLNKAGESALHEGEACFNECAEILRRNLYTEAQAAGLPSDLLSQLKVEKKIGKGAWYCRVGWIYPPITSIPAKLPDAYKVIFYNYGTPQRSTSLGYNRGEEKKTGFVRRAKNKSNREIKAAQEKCLGKILEGVDIVEKNF